MIAIDHDTFTLLQLALELLVGILAIVAFLLRMNSGGLSARELLKQLEEKDRQIERLRIRKAEHNYRTIQSKTKHLHLAKKRYTL